MRPPPVESFQPLLEDAKPLFDRPHSASRTSSVPTHGTPILLNAFGYHGPPSTSTVGVFMHACNARRMKQYASRPSRVGVSERYAQQFSALFSVSIAAQRKNSTTFLPSTFLDFRLVYRSRSSTYVVSAVQRAARALCDTTVGLLHMTLHRRS